MRAFFKEQINHPIKQSNGNAIPWELVGRNNGIRSLDEQQDAALIALLDKEADLRRNGIRRISADEYAGLKKNKPLERSTPPSGIVPPIRVYETEALLPKFRSPPSPSAPSAPVAASVNPPPPPVVSAPVPAPAPVAAPSPAPESKPADANETPARRKSKRGKLADLLAKEKAVAEAQ